jgi:hypothetical protein
MNLALPASELDDTEAQYIQDGLVDYPGLTRRRGPLRKVTGIANLTRKGSGLAMTLNPQGIDKYGVLNGDNSNGYFSVLSDDVTAVQADLVWPHPLPTTPLTPGQQYRNVDIKPSLNGGAWIGVSSSYDANSPNQGLALWMGANRANYSAGSVTVARGSAALTAPSGFTANVVAGMWLFANTDEPYTNALIGLVRSVNSDTSITLDSVSPYNVTAKAATFQALRGFAPKVGVGYITVDTSSATVTGGKTKFSSDGLSTGTWQIYRARDMAFVGKVLSVTTEISLTLAANAAVAMAEDKYIAIRADADFSISTTASTQKVGFLNATYAGRQWFANNGAVLDKTTRLWFSDINDPEITDLADFDGDWDDVTSSSTVNEPIRAIASANSGLVILKENETYLVTGNSPASFSPRKLEDDGTLSGMSVQQYGGGVIWAGREGIHFFDGQTAQNLTSDPVRPKLGDYWKNSIRTFDPATYRMYSMINRDHYFLFVEKISPTVPVIKGVVSHTPTQMTFVINMVTRAVTVMTNTNIRGAVTLPSSAGKHSWFLVNGRIDGEATDHAFIAEGEALFNEEGTDPISSDTEVSIGATTITNASPAVFTKVAHGLKVGDPVTFTTTGALPTGLVVGTTYYVIAAGFTVDAFEVSLTLGGAAVNTSSAGSGTHTTYRAWQIVGPDFFYESKKFSEGDSTRLKKFKQLMMHYLAQSGDIKVDTVIGLNDFGQVLSSTFPASVLTWDTLKNSVANWDAVNAQFATWAFLVQGVFKPKRVKFQRASTHLSFRLYQSTPSMTRLQIGPFAIGYKLKRPGRI